MIKTRKTLTGRLCLLATAAFWLLTLAPGAWCLPIGTTAPDFTLTDLTGKSHSLREYRGKNVIIVFIAARCPISRAYTDRLRAISRDYGSRPDSILLAINPSANESLDEIRRHAETNSLDFPILTDDRSAVADAYGAERTPDVFVVDPQGRLRYSGRIDSSHLPRRDTRPDLRLALDEILAGKPVTIPSTTAMGCPIVRPAKANADGQKSPAKSVATAGTPEISVRKLKPADYHRMLREPASRAVIVNFWATWCGPCVAEFPEFVKLDTQLRARGVRFVSISADEMPDLNDQVIPFLRKQNARFDHFIQDVDDPQEMIDVVYKDWPGTLPATFLYDKQGKLHFLRFGIIDRDLLIAEIEKILK